jgi:AraC-like DNA-binding protein
MGIGTLPLPWVNPSPAQTSRQLVIHGGFVVDDGRTRHLERRAQRLGFADLRGYLQARSDAGHSIPQLAAELDVNERTVKRSLGQGGVTLLPRAERLARQRRHATQQRLAAPGGPHGSWPPGRGAGGRRRPSGRRAAPSGWPNWDLRIWPPTCVPLRGAGLVDPADTGGASSGSPLAGG